MKMNKQNIYSTFVNSFTHATSRLVKYSGSYFYFNTNTTSLPWVYKVIFTTPGKSYKFFKTWMITALEGEAISAEEHTRKASLVHPYNFMATPQALYMLPGKARKRESGSTLSNNQNASAKA
jgi:hypothetical protein